MQRVSSRFEQNGFFEKEVAHTSETFGAITLDFSRLHESRHAVNDEKPFARRHQQLFSQFIDAGKRYR